MKRNLLILLTVFFSNYYYSQGYISIQTTTFAVTGPVSMSFYTLQTGVNYKLQMSGTWGDFSGVTSYDTRYYMTGTDFGYNYFITAPAWLKNLSPTPTGYSSLAHTYSLCFTGDGSTVAFTYTDSGYGDNTGVVKFELFQQCPSVNVSLTRDTAVCYSQSVTLAASGGTNYTWYDAATGGSVISTTSLLPVPFVSATDTFYVNTGFSNGCLSNRDTLILTVNPLPTVSFNFANRQLCENDQPFAMAGTPAGGTYSGAGVTGASFNPSAVVAGIYTVSYLYTSPQGCAASDTSQLSVSVCTGLNEKAQQNKPMIFPNPVAHFLNVTMPRDFKTTGSKIYNIQGLQLQMEIKNDQVNVSELPAGIYFLEIKTEAGTLRSRFIKE